MDPVRKNKESLAKEFFFLGITFFPIIFSWFLTMRINQHFAFELCIFFSQHQGKSSSNLISDLINFNDFENLISMDEMMKFSLFPKNYLCNLLVKNRV